MQSLHHDLALLSVCGLRARNVYTGRIVRFIFPDMDKVQTRSKQARGGQSQTRKRKASASSAPVFSSSAEPKRKKQLRWHKLEANELKRGLQKYGLHPSKLENHMKENNVQRFEAEQIRNKLKTPGMKKFLAEHASEIPNITDAVRNKIRESMAETGVHFIEDEEDDMVDDMEDDGEEIVIGEEEGPTAVADTEGEEEDEDEEDDEVDEDGPHAPVPSGNCVLINFFNLL